MKKLTKKMIYSPNVLRSWLLYYPGRKTYNTPRKKIAYAYKVYASAICDNIGAMAFLETVMPILFSIKSASKKEVPAYSTRRMLLEIIDPPFDMFDSIDMYDLLSDYAKSERDGESGSSKIRALACAAHIVLQSKTTEKVSSTVRYYLESVLNVRVFVYADAQKYKIKADKNIVYYCTICDADLNNQKEVQEKCLKICKSWRE